jgi:RNA polymerase sigma factor (sigma-70 family)
MARLFPLFRSDKSIIDAIANNNETVLDYLYQANLKMISKLVCENNGTEEDAVEILQDTLVLFWEKVVKGNLNLTSKISTYLYAVAKNKWLQELNRRKKIASIDDIYNNPGNDRSVMEQLEEEETNKIVRSCIKRLKPLCRKILILYYYHERSLREIKDITGLANEDVAKAKKYQCKKELENMLQSYFKDRIDSL